MEETELIKKIANNIENVIIGKKSEIYNIIKGIIAGGNILIEDVPGVGKTTLVKAVAKSIGLDFGRIQFTPDILPSDITGVSIYNPKTMEFEFRKGPVFTNILLADEINRASSRTQSALLQVMEEKQVTEWNNTYSMKEPFIVFATENPVEHEGVYQLPEAQLDRFMIKVSIGYPSKEYEASILETYRNNNPLEKIERVATVQDILAIQEKVRQIKVSKSVYGYIVDIVRATREDESIILGASVRASMCLMKMGQAEALINGRDYVIPEDIKQNAAYVLCHRIKTAASKANALNICSIINTVIDSVNMPRVYKDV